MKKPGREKERRKLELTGIVITDIYLLSCINLSSMLDLRYLDLYPTFFCIDRGSHINTSTIYLYFTNISSYFFVVCIDSHSFTSINNLAVY